MVKLTKIYTRTGDRGTTALADMSRVSKTHPRIAAYGDVDEVNSLIGIIRTMPEAEPFDDILQTIQNELFDVGADLATPIEENPQWEPLRISQASIERLEQWCDDFNESLAPLSSFVLPAGTPLAAHFHMARTVVRRAERHAWAAFEDETETFHELALTYLNRLSDLLFLAARLANKEVGEILWIPGKDRQTPHLRAQRLRDTITSSQESLSADGAQS